MVIKLSPELEAALNASARRQGVPPDVLATNNVLRERFLSASAPTVPQDDWERIIVGLGTDCGVSLPDSVLTREEQ